MVLQNLCFHFDNNFIHSWSPLMCADVDTIVSIRFCICQYYIHSMMPRLIQIWNEEMTLPSWCSNVDLVFWCIRSVSTLSTLLFSSSSPSLFHSTSYLNGFFSPFFSPSPSSSSFRWRTFRFNAMLPLLMMTRNHHSAKSRIWSICWLVFVDGGEFISSLSAHIHHARLVRSSTLSHNQMCFVAGWVQNSNETMGNMRMCVCVCICCHPWIRCIDLCGKLVLTIHPKQCVQRMMLLGIHRRTRPIDWHSPIYSAKGILFVAGWMLKNCHANYLCWCR